MNNRYIFRGKGNPKYNDGEWYYGYLEYDGSDYQIVDPEYGSCKRTIITETVGQCTGLKDKNGKLIFEGDVVHFKTRAYYYKNCRIKYQAFYARYCAIDNKGYEYPMDKVFEYEIIGNIHDNKELFEVER